MTVLGYPVVSDATREQSEYVARQVGHLDPREYEIAIVVGDASKPCGTRLGVPADEAVPWGRLPCSGAEYRAGDDPVIPVADKIPDRLSNICPESQIVMGCKQFMQ
jgi:hypothetical protein